MMISASGSKNSNGNEKGEVTYCQYIEMKRQKTRFCDLSLFAKHQLSITSHKHAKKCAVCNLPAYKKCAICGVSLHNNDSRGAAKGKNCFLQWHDEHHFGLCYDDRHLVGVKPSEWKPPTQAKINQNRRMIKQYKGKAARRS